MNLNEDPLMAECLLCTAGLLSHPPGPQLTFLPCRPNQAWTNTRRRHPTSSSSFPLTFCWATQVGNLASEKPADIRLSGSSILAEHCHFECTDGIVTIHSRPNSTTMVNGQRVNPTKVKRDTCRLVDIWLIVPTDSRRSFTLGSESSWVISTFSDSSELSCCPPLLHWWPC